MTKSPASPLSDCLNQGPLASLLLQAQHYQQCQQLVQEALPPSLSTCCYVLGISPAGVIKLGVSSAAAATKIRQLLPRVLQHLQSHQWKVTDISLKVQARPLTAATQINPHRQFNPKEISQQGLDAFVELQGSIKKGALAEAITRLIERRKH